MGHSFDEMVKVLARGVSRRDAFKFVGAGVLGTMLVNLGVREAEAACSGASCGACAVLCKNDPGDQCICVFKVKNGACITTRPPKCIQNFFCSGTQTCTSTAQCRPLGKNFKCIDSACCGVLGICAPKCGTVPPCCSAQTSGASAAG